MSSIQANLDDSAHAGEPLGVPRDGDQGAALGPALDPPRRETAVRVHLVCADSAFGDTAVGVLRRIDPGCRIERRLQSEIDAHGGAQPELILIDIDVPPGGGSALVEHARRHYPHSAIVAVSSALDHTAIDRTIEAGASGYLPKTYTRALVEGVLRLVIGGEAFRPQWRRHSPARHSRPPALDADTSRKRENDFGLTAREIEVLSQIAHGCSNFEIGKRLGMEETTVKRHVYNIFGKLNVNNRAAAALVGARLAVVQRTQMKEAEQGHLTLSWLQPEMSHRRMRAGQTIFRAGDVSNALYALQRGSVRLPEIGATVRPTEVFGEIGIFAPEHKRTCSAVCETDVDLFSLTSEQVKRIYFANPQFAFFILHLVATRLMADRQRAER